MTSMRHWFVPFGMEEEPVRDLSILSCGHPASHGAWRTYESMNQGRNLCPVCKLPVEDISKPLPMGKIGDIVQRIREEYRGLNDLLNWNQGIIPINRQDVSVSEEKISINLPEQVVPQNPQSYVSVLSPLSEMGSRSGPPNPTISSTKEPTGVPQSHREDTIEEWINIWF